MKNIKVHKRLSERQAMVVGLWFRAYTSIESSKILNISARTVEEYRTRAKNKYDATNRNELRAILQKRGEISHVFKNSILLAQKKEMTLHG
jgi:DNA-binding CsgD family transcriptional regulator